MHFILRFLDTGSSRCRDILVLYLSDTAAGLLQRSNTLQASSIAFGATRKVTREYALKLSTSERRDTAAQETEFIISINSPVRLRPLEELLKALLILLTYVIRPTIFARTTNADDQFQAISRVFVAL